MQQNYNRIAHLTWRVFLPYLVNCNLSIYNIDVSNAPKGTIVAQFFGGGEFRKALEGKSFPGQETYETTVVLAAAAASINFTSSNFSRGILFHGVRNICYSLGCGHLYSTPPSAKSRRNFAKTFSTGKLEWFGYHTWCAITIIHTELALTKLLQQELSYRIDIARDLEM